MSYMSNLSPGPIKSQCNKVAIELCMWNVQVRSTNSSYFLLGSAQRTSAPTTALDSRSQGLQRILSIRADMQWFRAWVFTQARQGFRWYPQGKPSVCCSFFILQHHIHPWQTVDHPNGISNMTYAFAILISVSESLTAYVLHTSDVRIVIALPSSHQCLKKRIQRDISLSGFIASLWCKERAGRPDPPQRWSWNVITGLLLWRSYPVLAPGLVWAFSSLEQES